MCPVHDVFKTIYKSEWPKHAQNVNSLIEEIKKRFPQVSLRTGLGAESDERIDIPPAKKNEPDIEVWLTRRHLISIEVTGSDKVLVPPGDIWILAKKLTVGKESIIQGIDYLFYLVYPNNSFTLTVDIVNEYRRSVGPGGRLPGEKYIKIPAGRALPREEVFNYIRAKISPLYPQLRMEVM